MARIELPSFGRIELPSSDDIAASGACPSEHFRIGACEAEMMDSIAAEHIQNNGTEILYYRIDRARSTWDPVYSEPIDLVFSPPLRLLGRVQKPEKVITVGERGTTVAWDAMLWLPRLCWAGGAPGPSAGDVVGFWSTPYFKSTAVVDDAVPRADHFYDVVNAVTDGHVADTAHFVAYEITLKRRSEFTPERRLVELDAR